MTTDSHEARHERLRRRRYDEAFKRTLVEQTRAPGASVARIAREHGINANQLFNWRRQFLLAEQGAPASLVPVTVVAEDETHPSCAPSPTVGDGQIEIRLAGATVRVQGAADAVTLRVVLESLRP